MKHWESLGKSDEWYTPAYIFEALGCHFDLDVASPKMATKVPCSSRYTESSLEKDWNGFIWMNPPFGGRNGLVPWLNKFFEHGHGIALTPDRTSSNWWQDACEKSDAILLLRGKVKFERPDGSTGNSPANGTTLFAKGRLGVESLEKASKNGLGVLLVKTEKEVDNNV